MTEAISLTGKKEKARKLGRGDRRVLGRAREKKEEREGRREKGGERREERERRREKGGERTEERERRREGKRRGEREEWILATTCVWFCWRTL
jgi:hypothetical protein